MRYFLAAVLAAALAVWVVSPTEALTPNQRVTLLFRCPALVPQTPVGNCPSAPLQAETTTLLAAFAVPATAGRATAINIAIYNLKQAGLWSKMDVCYDGTAETSQQALLNWVTPASFTGTTSGSLTQAPNIGWKFDGSTGFIDTHWVPNTNAVQMTATNAALMVYDYTNVASSTQFDVGVSAVDILSLNGRDASSRIFGPINVTSNSGAIGTTTVTTSVGTAIASRSGGTTSFYHNGVAAGSYSPATSGLSTLSLYIGAQHIAGNANNFSSRIVSFVCAGSSLTAANAASLNSIITDYINKVAPLQPNVYVSNNVGNGLPVGSDTLGVGTAAAPFLTFDVGLGATKPTQTLVLNCDATHAGTYTSANTTITLSAQLTIAAGASNCSGGGATLKATGGTQGVITTSPASGQTITLRDLVIDGQSTYANAIFYSDKATTYTVSHTGVTATNVTDNAFRGGGSAERVSLTYDGGGCTLGAAPGCIFSQARLNGATTVRNFTCSITNANLQSHGCIILKAIAGASGVTASVTGSSLDVAIDAAAPAGTYIGVEIQNIPGAVIDSNTLIKVENHVAGTVGVPIGVYPSNDANSQNSGNFVISNNVVKNFSPAGYGIKVAQDNACLNGVGQLNGGVVFGNDVEGDSTSATALMHAVLTGCYGNTVVHNNSGHTLGFCVGDKYGIGVLAYDNVCWDVYTYGLILKGSANFTGKHNTIATAQSGISAMVKAEDATDVGAPPHTTGAAIVGNAFAFSGFTNGKMVLVDASNEASFSNNSYFSDAGPLSATSWSYQGTSYDFTTWNSTFEGGTATQADPAYVNLATPTMPSDLSLSGPGINALIPFDATVPLDFAGLAFKTPSSAIGAYECYAGGC